MTIPHSKNAGDMNGNEGGDELAMHTITGN
jgi:hypothetical protein